MSILTMAWSMTAAACCLLGLMHLILWLKLGRFSVYMLSSLMAFSAGAVSILELNMLTTESLDTYRTLIRLLNIAIFMTLVPMVWYFHLSYKAGRLWLVFTITLLWSIGLLANFFSAHSLTFNEIIALKQYVTFWGETFSVPVGSENPWKYLTDIASLLILIYIADASLMLWRRGKHERKSAAIVGGGVIFFIVAAGIHTPLVDTGLVSTPYMISFSFLAIVMTMSYQMMLEVFRARDYDKELQETRQTLNQLARSSMLGECTTMLTHELNQPLTAILSNAQAARRYLEADKGGKAEIMEILDDIVRDDKRAGDIISHLRQMVRKEESNRNLFDLNLAIREVIELLIRDLDENNIRLVTHFDDDLPGVWAGEIEIQQVVLNFITNAIKAMTAGGSPERQITIHTSNSGNAIRVAVEDSGPGIPEYISKTLFNSFIGDSPEGLGLGMGLAISRRIIESHSGHIDAENRRNGGAVFWFSLPVNRG